jgi:hypothetical protein
VPPRNPEQRHTRRRVTRETLDKASEGQVWVSSQFALDLATGRWDIDFFARRFLGIDPHPGQSRFFNAVLMRDQTGWRPRYLDINLSAGNRAGKTLAEAIAHFHSTFYKLGQKPPSMRDEQSLRRWMLLDYEWYHFAIAQETSELAFIEITRILQGTHEAQKHGCPLTQELGPLVARWDKKYRGEYLWLQIHPAFGGGSIHYRTTGEKAIGSLGKDMHGVSYDEGAFDPNFDFVMNEVLHMRRLSTGGQLWAVGTSTEGLTAFADHWFKGDPDAPDRKPDSMSLRMSTRENIGYGIDRLMFDRLVASMPPELVPQNIDGLFLEGRKSFFSQAAVDAMFVDTLDEHVAAKRGHVYVQGADPALTFDSTWSIVLDVAKTGVATGVSAQHQTGRTTGPVIAALVTDQHRAYDGRDYACTTGIDSTGFGGAMFRDLLPIPVRSVEFGGTRGKKLKLLNDLKKAIETGSLRFPRSGPWLVLRRQLLGYRLDDRKLSTDAVMALAVAVKMANLNPVGSQPSAPFDYFGSEQGGVSSLPSGSPFSPAVSAFGRAAVTYSSVSDMVRHERQRSR